MNYQPNSVPSNCVKVFEFSRERDKMYQSDEDAIPINLIHLVPRSPNIDPSNVVMKQQIPSTNYLSLFRGI